MLTDNIFIFLKNDWHAETQPPAEFPEIMQHMWTSLGSKNKQVKQHNMSQYLKMAHRFDIISIH